MNKFTVTYGLIPPPSENTHEAHILPVTKIINPSNPSNFVLTSGRDGTVIKHTFTNGSWQRLKMQVNSDWVSDMVEIDERKFIVVSHDFFVSLLTLGADDDTWSTEIIGYHDDYVKCVAFLGRTDDSSVKFATCGLDMKIKIWLLKDSRNCTLLHTFDNHQPLETGSLYALVAITGGSLPFDLIAGDNNGNLILISSSTGKQYAVISAHATNIKLIHLMDNDTKILSTSSDGMLKLWDLQKLGKETIDDALIHSWKWAAPVWSIEGSNFHDFFVGDSRGAITHIDFSNGEWEAPKLQTIVPPPDENCGGILALRRSEKGKLWYSYSSCSNLCTVDLETREIGRLEGGSALLRCSLLTNRRHVITQNTKAVIQKWDIISCELLDTFDSDAGTFDEVVLKSNTKEVWPHWCSVSIKTGKLFVKLTQKFLSTEVYGSALQQYTTVNKVDLEIDNRYNLGLVAINSLLNEFINYILEKDKLFRKDLVSKKSSVPGSPAQPPTDSTSSEPGRPNVKEKRRLSLFTKFTSSDKQPATPNSQASTPLLNTEDELPVDDQLLLPPPATAPPESGTPKFPKAEHSQPPALAKRSASSGSLLTQKFKMFSNTNSSQALTRSDAEDTVIKHTHHETSSIPRTPGDDPGGPNNQQMPVSRQDTEAAKSDDSGSTADDTEKKHEHLSDFLADLRAEYVKEYDPSASSFKLLGKKVPPSKIKRDNDSPIIDIKTGVLLSVNRWKEGSCGDAVCFSTFLPAPHNKQDLNVSDCEESRQKVQMFQNLESNLPYWMAQALFKGDKTSCDYPKLTFVLKPWQDPDSPPHSGNASSNDQSQPQASHHHHHLSFHRSKNGDQGPKPLPTVSEAYTKLHAPSVIKIKKVLLYVVDRFETKTLEMKAKTPASDWLELLCKNQVLDNDLALSSVKTLYWKSQGDIVLEYRKKVSSSA